MEQCWTGVGHYTPRFIVSIGRGYNGQDKIGGSFRLPPIVSRVRVAKCVTFEGGFLLHQGIHSTRVNPGIFQGPLLLGYDRTQ